MLSGAMSTVVMVVWIRINQHRERREQVFVLIWSPSVYEGKRKKKGCEAEKKPVAASIIHTKKEKKKGSLVA